jgi:general secretion pathway protein A
MIMFETFYGLTYSPFSRDNPTGELYESVVLEETLGRLQYAAQRQWFAVVTGDCGTGKTTTIRRFSEVLDSAKYKVLYLSDSKLTPRHFYKVLLEQLGCESKFYRGDAKRQLHKEIELMQGIHRLKPVVIVDEAHLLDKEMLEEVRFLLNFKMDHKVQWRSSWWVRVNYGIGLIFKLMQRFVSGLTCNVSWRITIVHR